MARVHLGMKNAEFYSLIPRQFHLLIDQHRERVEHQELLAGIVASEIANRSTRHPEKWALPIDFMPSKANQKQKRPTRDHGQKISDNIRTWVDRMRSNGLVKTNE